jgi:hypothetical protein
MAAASVTAMNHWWAVCQNAQKDKTKGFKCAESVERVEDQWFTYREKFIDEIPHTSHQLCRAFGSNARKTVVLL